jgi:hypothetical protein
MARRRRRSTAVPFGTILGIPVAVASLIAGGVLLFLNQGEEEPPPNGDGELVPNPAGPTIT